MKIVKLGDYINLVGGGTPSKEVDSFWNGDIPWASVKDFKSDFISSTVDKITLEGVINSATRIIPKGTLLIATRMAVGKVAFAQMDVAINQDLKAIICNPELYNKFLFYILKSKTDYFESVSSGATVQGIKINHIVDIQIPLPPLSTQKRIAAILDTADLYRQTTKALVAKYDQLAQSLFLEMFGDPMRNRENWKTKKMQDVCVKITDGTHFSPEPQSEGFPYVTAKHVKEYGLDFDSKPTFICEEAHNEIYKRCTPEFGDVLYIKDGATTGIACINTFKEPISLLSSLALLKLNSEELNSYYLCYWLNHKGIKEKLLNEYMSGAAIQRYTLTKINSFIITVPPISLQTQFATRIQLIEAHKQQALAALQKSETLFNSLLQKAFKGELVS